MTTTTKVEVRPEDAQKALKRAKGLLHVWAPLVRAIARNPKLKVELTSGAPRTDGKTVWLRVPIELAFHEHHKSECGKWDEGLNQFVCPACTVELDCDMALFHEVSHLLAGSFDPDDPDEELLALMREVWPKAEFDLRAMSIAGLGYGASDRDYPLVQRLAQRFPDQWGFFAFNVVEDVYVNESITSARKGLVLIFKSAYEKMMREGILMPDGETKIFSDLHPFIQACAAWSLAASGQPEVVRYLDPEVVAKVQSSKVMSDLAIDITKAATVLDRFKISMKLLLELERLGYYAREPEPDDTPGEGGDPCEDGDPAEGEGEGDGTGGESMTEPCEGESSGEAEGDPDGTPGDGSSPDGGVEVDTDKPDSPTTSPGEGSGDTDGAGESKNDDGIEPDSDGSTSEDGGDDTHGEEADTSEAGDGEAGEGDGEGADAPSDHTESAPGEGASSLEDSGGGKIDHDAEPTEGDGGDVELPSIEEARAAFEHLTGHEGFGDDEEMAEALGDPESTEPTDYASKKTTELVESALSFDGKLDHIDGNLVSMCTQPRLNSRSLIGDAQPRGAEYDLPTEIMAPAAQRMRLAFAANRKVGNERGLKSGSRLDAKTLGYRIPAGDDRIFARRTIPKRRDWTVLIGIDVSGSTRSGALEVEKKVAIGIGDLLTQVGIPFTVYLHTGTRYGDGYQLIVAPLKGENQLWKGDGRDNVRRLRSGAANLDGHTMQAYRKLLERQKGKDKLLLYFTDGAMPAENRIEEKEILIRECALLKAKGIHTVGVGIGCDDPRRYGLDTIEVNGTRDIPTLLQGIGERLTR